MGIQSGQIYAQRFTLDSQVETSRAGSTWKAFDQSLNRWVCLFLLPVTDPRSTIVTTNCEATGGIETRGVVALYDVIHAAPLAKVVNDGNPNQYFTGVVTEWVVGNTLQELLSVQDDMFRPLDALRMCTSLAQTLEEVHGHGITHSMLSPQNVIFADSNEVRIIGLGIDKSLEHESLPENIQDDIRALGRILFTAVTNTPWKDAPHQGASDNHHRSIVVPSSFASDIPKSVDTLYAATQTNGFTSMHEVVEALSVSISELDLTARADSSGGYSHHAAAKGGASSDSGKRAKTLALAALFITVLAWSGWRLTTMNIHRDGVPNALLPSSQWTTTPTALPTKSTKPVSYDLATITSIRDYDPLGSGEENAKDVSNAIDNNYATAWSTVQYRQNNLSGKAGVGLIIDLGASQSVKAVATDFFDPGVSFKVFVTDNENPDAQKLTPMGIATDADTHSVITATTPQSGRYVLVWLTYLPQVANGSYQAGIAEVQVRL